MSLSSFYLCTFNYILQTNSPSISTTAATTSPHYSQLYSHRWKTTGAHRRTDELITRWTERKTGSSFTAERKNTLTKETGLNGFCDFNSKMPKWGEKKAWFICMKVKVKIEFCHKNRYKVNKTQECQNSGTLGKVLCVCQRQPSSQASP